MRWKSWKMKFSNSAVEKCWFGNNEFPFNDSWGHNWKSMKGMIVIGKNWHRSIYLPIYLAVCVCVCVCVCVRVCGSTSILILKGL